MTTRFGPQLIGETEKALDAILRRALAGTGLTEAHWVTLRLASGMAEGADAGSLAGVVAERARFADAAELVDSLTERRLLEGGRLTPDGHRHVEAVQARIAEATAPIWLDLPAGDVAATERLLNEIVARARRVLAGHA